MKEILNRKGTSGISLVALIVTIIVLIILTAAVIVTFMEGGIIDRAKKAVFRSDIRNYQDILLVKNANNKIDRETGTGEEELLNAETLAEIQVIIPEFKKEYENLVKIENGKLVLGTREDQPYRDWLIELGIEAGSNNGGATNGTPIASAVAVGDYVNYSALINGGTSSVEIAGENSGYYEGAPGSPLQGQTITRDATINWRVLSIEGNTITLISDEPVNSIGLGGTAGYLNGPGILDNTYDAFYSTSVGTARNLRVEDVNKVMEYGTNGVPSTIEVTIGTSDAEGLYPIRETVDYGITIGELESTYNIALSNRSTPSGDIENYPITCYWYTGSDYKPTTSDEYKMIFGTSGNYNYWLSSSCTNADYQVNWATFYLRYVRGQQQLYADVNAREMYWSYGGSYATSSGKFAGRPIVILNSNLQVVPSEGTHTTSGTAWEIAQ